MLRIDLHVHSGASRDAKGSLRELALAAKDRGLDGFAITDHNVVPDMDELQDVQAETGIVILPGAEWSTIEGHLLAIGTTVVLAKDVSMGEAIAAIHASGGLAIPSHPLRLLTGAGPSVLERLSISLVEGRNGRDRKLVQDNTMALADRLGLATTGGTDAHWITDIGTAYTMVDAEPNVTAIIEALRAGKCSAAGDTLSRRSIVGNAVKRMRRSK
jgi:predicted metal-dependent phosphoesterase TrpH